MKNKRAASNLKFSSNLCEQTVHLIEFLKGVYGNPELQRPSVLKRAIYRYEKYWLPLAAEHPNKCLAPPLDIEWAWHCHMLCPNTYEKDCNAIVGTTVNHTMSGATKFYEKQPQSQKYWLAMFGNELEPFTVDYKAPYDLVTIEAYHSKITYDILAAAKRQMDLYYHVSLPHYRDRKYLQKCLFRYKQFLYLKKRLPNEFLEPSYDIDLIWHSHQLNPRLYKEDILRFVGYFLNHGLSVDHRTEEDKLTADKLSRETWKYFYNETMPIFGAMYRVNRPAIFLYKISPQEEYRSCTKSIKMTFEKITLSVPLTNKNIILSVSSSADERTFGNWFSVKSRGEQRLSTDTVTWTSVSQLEMDTKNARCLYTVLQEQDGSKTIIGSNIMNILPLIEYTANTGSERRVRVNIPIGTDIRLDFYMRLEAPIVGRTLLALKQGNYETTVTPTNFQQFFGSAELKRLSQAIDNRCDVATHRLKDTLGNVDFSVRTMHCQLLMMSVIQVYYRDKMSVIGHLVSSDHLPLPTQVHQDEITLNPMQGERAIIIKNNGGDWGIVTGRWKGFKPEITRDIHGASKAGSPGTMFLKFFKFSTGKTSTVELGYHRKDYVCSLESAQIDLMKGVLIIDSSVHEVAENIALAFSVSLLHVLCVPRPKGSKEGQQVKSAVKVPKSRQITSVPSTDMKFITAAGLFHKTPSNNYMQGYKRGHICRMTAGGCLMELV
ncbi:uncharacterized protein LOC123528744 [Mercenaria mercenaria]|uniref:uncharacterized protein LOC123528744 n=1 Tax=Mercenaria mercenaria TaxID=6596 RepID=UPI00234EBE9B|nr:uncharacterized protein LOC123528744 [Mercenaria mercenaria]